MQWRVKYLDGTEETGEGILSKYAWDNSPSIIFFYVGDYTLDLTTGTFDFNGFKILSPWGEQKYRLIYYRKIEATIAESCSIDKIDYFFGWQVTIDGKCYKKIYQIGNNCVTVIE